MERASDLAQEEVRSYYTAIDGQDFATAWDKLGTSVQDQLGGRDQWEKGFKDHLSNDVSLSVSSATPSSASVAVTLTSKDMDACARTVTQTFEGTWQVEPISGNWIATALDMRRTSGHTPETDINKCLPSTPTPSTPDIPSPNNTPSDPYPSTPSTPPYTPPSGLTPNERYGPPHPVPCSDGTISPSGGHPGACSHHGGEL